MSKKTKIYDILPPKLAYKIEEDIKEYFEKEKDKFIKKVKKEEKISKKRKKKWSFWFSFIFLIAFLIVLVGGYYLLFELPRATIKIWPKVEVLAFQQTLTADASALSIDFTKGILPARIVEVFKNLTESFPASGNLTEEGRASGIITIYNKSDPPVSLTLKAGTHFMSDSGKVFRANERIVVPAGQKSGNKIIPGSVKVKVQAVEGGTSYNIPPSNFSIPGLKGTNFYYTVYAVSEEPMTGGYTGESKKVIEDDIKEAKETLIQKAILQAKEELKKEIPSDHVLLDFSIFSEVLEAKTAVKPGTAVDSFNYQASVRVKALSLKKSDVDEFVKKYIISQMPSNKTLWEESLGINYGPAKEKKEGDIFVEKLPFELSFSAGIYPTIDKNSLSLLLRGKNSYQISEIVKRKIGEDQISKVEVEFWPFWVSRAPRQQKGIKILLNFLNP